MAKVLLGTLVLRLGLSKLTSSFIKTKALSVMSWRQNRETLPFLVKLDVYRGATLHYILDHFVFNQIFKLVRLDFNENSLCLILEFVVQEHLLHMLRR